MSGLDLVTTSRPGYLEPVGHAGRLLRRHWPALVTIAVAGKAASSLAVRAAVGLNDTSWLPYSLTSVVVMLLVALASLSTLVAVVAMLYTVRDDLPELSRLRWLRDRTAVAGGPEPVGRFVELVAVAMVPFLALWAAWGYLDDVTRRVGLGGLLRGSRTFVAGPATTAFVIAAGVCFVAVWLLRRRHRSRWALVVVFGDACYLFFAAWGIGHYTRSGWDWLRSRVVWQAVADRLDRFRAWADSVLVDWSFDRIADLLAALPGLVDTFVLPVVWLAMAMIVLGHLLDRRSGTLAETETRRRLLEQYLALPGEIRLLVDRFTSGPRDKWAPIARSADLLWHAGPLMLLIVGIVFHLLTALAGWATIGVTRLIGPHTTTTWLPWRQLLFDADETIRLVLVVPLLAATVDWALRRLSR